MGDALRQGFARQQWDSQNEHEPEGLHLGPPISFLTHGDGASDLRGDGPGVTGLSGARSKDVLNQRRTTAQYSSWRRAYFRWWATPSYALLRPPISAVVPRSGRS